MRKQDKYYASTAASYDSMHVKVDDEHYTALRHISSIIGGMKSVLDVGCGTGRGVRYFLQNHPGLKVMGVDPSPDLLKAAKGIPKKNLKIGSGESLPFPDNSFDAVCALGVMHHVRHPEKVINEMMRVARKGIFISDSNRFGQGIMPERVAKLLLHRARLWPIVNLIKTTGKGYTYTEGDGISYSYSVYDNMGLYSKWADRIILIPTSKDSSGSWHQPLLTSSHILVCLLKNPVKH